MSGAAPTCAYVLPETPLSHDYLSRTWDVAITCVLRRISLHVFVDTDACGSPSPNHEIACHGHVILHVIGTFRLPLTSIETLAFTAVPVTVSDIPRYVDRARYVHISSTSLVSPQVTLPPIHPRTNHRQLKLRLCGENDVRLSLGVSTHLGNVAIVLE